MTSAEAKALVAILKAAFPLEEVEQTTFDLYASMLADLDFADARVAVETLAKTRHHFPRVAHIRETALDARYPIPGAAEAWELVCAAGALAMREQPMMRDDQSRMIDDLPPIVARALRIVGGERVWRYDENPQMLRSQFLRVYAELREATLAGGTDARQRALAREETRELAAAAAVSLPELRSMDE